VKSVAGRRGASSVTKWQRNARRARPRACVTPATVRPSPMSASARSCPSRRLSRVTPGAYAVTQSSWQVSGGIWELPGGGQVRRPVAGGGEGRQQGAGNRGGGGRCGGSVNRPVGIVPGRRSVFRQTWYGPAGTHHGVLARGVVVQPNHCAIAPTRPQKQWQRQRTQMSA